LRVFPDDIIHWRLTIAPWRRVSAPAAFARAWVTCAGIMPTPSYTRIVKNTDIRVE